ncbi:MAG: hypothetical protein GC168_13155 [Candidatus Hydrogenedens sp.]|nr:hypothetical protein [Candidatus Hydrogenedens sp.]
MEIKSGLIACIGMALVVSALSAGNAAAQPENDFCAGAIPLVLGETVVGSNEEATASGTASCVETDIYDVWYRFDAAASGYVDFHVALSEPLFDSTLSIYDACGGALLACNDDDGLEFENGSLIQCFSVSAGSSYLLRVAGIFEQVGPFTLTAQASVDCVPLENDDCASAVPLLEGIEVQASLVGATGSFTSSCSTGDYADVWYAYTATADAQMNFTTCGSDFDTTLSIFDVCGGSVLACSDDDICGRRSFISGFPVSNGTTYLVRVSGYAGDQGNYVLGVYSETRPLVTFTAAQIDSPTNAADIPFLIQFDREVLGFDAESDLVIVENGVTHSGFTLTGSSYEYTATLTGVTGEGTLTISVDPASDVTSLSAVTLGNTLVSPVVVIDHTGPGLVLSRAGGDQVSGPVTVLATANEPLNGFELADLVASNAIPSSLSGNGADYSFTLTPGIEGAFDVSVPGGVFTDAAGNPNAPSNVLTLTYDSTAPVISGISVTPSIAGSGDTVRITFDTSEPLNGTPQVTVNGNPADVEAKSGYAFVYTLGDYDPAGPAEVVVSGFDLAGNPGTAVATAAFTILPGPPAVPVAAWPAVLLLLGAGAASLRRR